MTEATTLEAKRRTGRGTRRARLVRAGGRVPGIIYGHGEEPEGVSLDSHDFEVALAHHQRTLALDLDGHTSQYLIKAVQYDHHGIKPIHVDLMRVDVDERVRVTVAIELRGVPKGVSEGGVLDQTLNKIDVECLATAIPETLQPFVSELDVNESFLVKDLELPDGVEVLTDPEEKVATVRVLAAEPEEVEVEAEPEEGEGEPQRIGRVRAEEETGGA